MLEVKTISSGYGNKQVLFDLSLEAKSGEIVLVTGGNGSGKSTFLKCIYNLLPLWKGEVRFNEQKISGLEPSVLFKKGIIYIPQKNFCFENLTVDENLKIAGHNYSSKELTKRLNYVYGEVGLSKLKKRKPFNLSGGEKKLLAFAISLINEPKLLLFDEPFSGVDSNTLKLLINLFGINFSKKDIAVIIVEHKITPNELVTKRILLDLGRIKTL